MVDITGERYGRLVVIERSGAMNGHVAWKCQCDCGKEHIARSGDLRQGRQISCGCIKKEGLHKTHGKSSSRLYRIWQNMKSRCTNDGIEAYKDYGGRGITICDEWKNDFQAFHDWAMANGYSDELSIDRISVNGNYEPSNCRWATRKEQANNKNDNNKITLKGETHTLAEWSVITGIKRATIKSRLDAGMDVEKALTEKPKGTE